MKKLFGLTAMSLTLLFSAAQAFAQFSLPNVQVTTTAFEDGGIIPIKYTSHGENIQPSFTITGAPDNTVSYAVIMHDIEVAIGGPGDVTHWVAFNIPSPNIAEGSLPAGSVNGNNIRNQPGYMGSGAPMRERYHHYVFEWYALSENLDLPEGATRDQVLAAMQGKVVGKAAIIGKYANAQPQ